ncbi:hypothetical protein HOH87_06225 [bacterium]|jgi:hypothetical protein|nr:hypothetical protein [bacterium]
MNLIKLTILGMICLIVVGCGQLVDTGSGSGMDHNVQVSSARTLSQSPSVAKLEDVNHVVVWSNTQGVNAQIFEGNTSISNQQILVEGELPASTYQMTSLGNGGIAIIYEKENDGIYLSRFSSQLVHDGTTQLSVIGTDPLISANDSRITVAWVENFTTKTQVLEIDGTIIQTITSGFPGSQVPTSLTSLIGDRFVLVGANGTDVHGLIYLGTGTSVTGFTIEGATEVWNPTAHSLENGQFVLTWHQAMGNGQWALYQKQFNSLGTSNFNARRVAYVTKNSATSEQVQVKSSFKAHITPLSGGDYVIVMRTYEINLNGSTFTRLFSQKYSAYSELIGKPLRINESEIQTMQFAPAAESIGGSTVVVAWESAGVIYTQRISPSNQLL